MWLPWRKRTPEEPADTRSLTKRVDDLELGQLEARDSQEKTLAAIKRIQGRLMKRVQVEEAEAASQEAPPALEGAPQVARGGLDFKAALRQRAAQLRASR